MVLLAWTSDRSADDILTRELGQPVSPEHPALVMYDSWTQPSLSDSAVFGELLSVLRLEAVSKKVDLIIRCGPDQVKFRKVLEGQGFQPQHRIVRHRLFHWLQWTRVSPTKQTVADTLRVGAVGI